MFSDQSGAIEAKILETVELKARTATPCFVSVGQCLYSYVSWAYKEASTAPQFRGGGGGGARGGAPNFLEPKLEIARRGQGTGT